MSYVYFYFEFLSPKEYNFLSNNCLHVAARALNKGTCSGKYAKEYQKAISCLLNMTIPNRAGSAMSYFERNIRNPKALNPYIKFYSDTSIRLVGIGLVIWQKEAKRPKFISIF